MESLPQWKSQFPDFPSEDMPELGANWDDVSWHNDVCPCFYNKDLNLYAWINYRDRAYWEHEIAEGETRITVMKADHKGELCEFDFDLPLIQSEEWDRVKELTEQTSLTALRNYEEIERDWICDRWTKRLGIGFHPDNEGAEITGMSEYEIREYESDMTRLFDISPDAYLDGLEAFQRAGLISEEG